MASLVDLGIGTEFKEEIKEIIHHNAEYR